MAHETPQKPSKQQVAKARADLEALALDLAKASSLQDPAAARILARTLAEQIMRHRLLADRDMRGELSPEVGRTVPAVARQIRDLARELGVTEQRKASGGFWGAPAASDGPPTAPEASEAPGEAPATPKRGPGRPRKTARVEPVDPVGEDEDGDEG